MLLFASIWCSKRARNGQSFLHFWGSMVPSTPRRVNLSVLARRFRIKAGPKKFTAAKPCRLFLRKVPDWSEAKRIRQAISGELQPRYSRYRRNLYSDRKASVESVFANDQYHLLRAGANNSSSRNGDSSFGLDPTGDCVHDHQGPGPSEYAGG